MNLKAATLGAVMALSLLACKEEANQAEPRAKQDGGKMELTQAWDKTFPKSDKVDHSKVTFKNRLGITLAGDLYLPKDFPAGTRLPAIATSGPYGAVKEQVSGRYAQAMAERGFAALAFDPSYSGESGGEPRQTVSYEAYVDDYSAAVDFLGTRAFVDRAKIGVIGICGGGGFSLSAASIDPRIRAIATVSMYDMGRATRAVGTSHPAEGDTSGEAGLKAFYAEIAEERWKEAEGAEPVRRYGTPATLPENASPVTKEFFDFYRNPERGEHPGYKGQLITSQPALASFYPFEQIHLISPRPILLVVGEHAHSRFYSEDAYARAAEPKELYVVPGANHVDLYDQMDKIPFAKLESFFKENLK